MEGRGTSSNALLSMCVSYSEEFYVVLAWFPCRSETKIKPAWLGDLSFCYPDYALPYESYSREWYKLPDSIIIIG